MPTAGEPKGIFLNLIKLAKTAAVATNGGLKIPTLKPEKT